MRTAHPYFPLYSSGILEINFLNLAPIEIFNRSPESMSVCLLLDDTSVEVSDLKCINFRHENSFEASDACVYNQSLVVMKFGVFKHIL